MVAAEADQAGAPHGRGLPRGLGHDPQEGEAVLAAAGMFDGGQELIDAGASWDGLFSAISVVWQALATLSARSHAPSVFGKYAFCPFALDMPGFHDAQVAASQHGPGPA